MQVQCVLLLIWPQQTARSRVTQGNQLFVPFRLISLMATYSSAHLDKRGKPRNVLEPTPPIELQTPKAFDPLVSKTSRVRLLLILQFWGAGMSLSGTANDSRVQRARVRVPRQEQRENCLLQGQLSVLTFISIPVPPPVLSSQ